MSNRKLLGCWGLLVGLVLAVMLGWMVFEALVHASATLVSEGMTATLTDSLLHHMVGELAVVGAIVVILYAWALGSGGAYDRTLRSARWVLWAGGLLNLAAWLRSPAGTRGTVWMLILAALGLLLPFVPRKTGAHR